MRVKPLVPLPFAIETLLNPQAVETTRKEFKKTWNEAIKPAVVRTACAFANDLYNLNGGYILLGIEEDEHGKPKLPPHGVDDLNLDTVQKEIYGACKAISPDYQPQFFIETWEGKKLLILQCPGGGNRPYHAPNERQVGAPDFFVRQGSQTVVARDDTLRQLMEQASKVPFDDRRHFGATLDDISLALVRSYLRTVKSNLGSVDLLPIDLYQKLSLLTPVNGHFEPRNIALMLFNLEPEQFFRGTYIEYAVFPGSRAGSAIHENKFDGPIINQLRSCLQQLETLCTRLIFKREDVAQADHIYAYPFRALQEALVNAVYHRGYDQPEPIKIYVEPDGIRIISFPGPHPRIRPEHFVKGAVVPTVPARNRRIGEFLKESNLAEARGSGFLRIHILLAENGSPPVEVDCDATVFELFIPIHPAHAIPKIVTFINRSELREAQRLVDSVLKRLSNTKPNYSVPVEILMQLAYGLGTLLGPVPISSLIQAGPTQIESILSQAMQSSPNRDLAASSLILVVRLAPAGKIMYALVVFLFYLGESEWAYFALCKTIFHESFASISPLFRGGYASLLAQVVGMFAYDYSEEIQTQLYAEALDLLESSIEILAASFKRTSQLPDGKLLEKLYLRLAVVYEALEFPIEMVRRAKQKSLVIERTLKSMNNSSNK